MKRPMRGDMPLAVTLPLHFDLRLRTRQRRWRRLAVGLLLALAAALLTMGFWLPAKAGLAQQQTAASSAAWRISASARREDEHR